MHGVPRPVVELILIQAFDVTIEHCHIGLIAVGKVYAISLTGKIFAQNTIKSHLRSYIGTDGIAKNDRRRRVVGIFAVWGSLSKTLHGISPAGSVLRRPLMKSVGMGVIAGIDNVLQIFAAGTGDQFKAFDPEIFLILRQIFA